MKILRCSECGKESRDKSDFLASRSSGKILCWTCYDDIIPIEIPPQFEIPKPSMKMNPNDWNPLIDAMKHLSNVPCCGDTAKDLLGMFRAAKRGDYYYIEICNDDKQCDRHFAVIAGFGSEEEVGAMRE